MKFLIIFATLLSVFSVAHAKNKKFYPKEFLNCIPVVQSSNEFVDKQNLLNWREQIIRNRDLTVEEKEEQSLFLQGLAVVRCIALYQDQITSVKQCTQIVLEKIKHPFIRNTAINACHRTCPFQHPYCSSCLSPKPTFLPSPKPGL